MPKSLAFKVLKMPNVRYFYPNVRYPEREMLTFANIFIKGLSRIWPRFTGEKRLGNARFLSNVDAEK